MQFLKCMEDANESSYPQVNATRDPLPLMVKVPGMNNFQFLYRLNTSLGSPLEAKTALEGHFLAYHKEIDDISKQPRVIVLPKVALNIQYTDITSIESFDANLKLNKYSTNTWFTTKTATMVMSLSKIFLAYDAFNEDIPAHIIYEQIQDIDEEDNPDSYYDAVKGFLCAVHTSQKVYPFTVELPEQLFQARYTTEAKQYWN